MSILVTDVRTSTGQGVLSTLEKAGIVYTALDNGFRSCDNPAALQRICDRLGPGAVKSFFWRWCLRVPSPFTAADRRAGYVYELAVRQFEVSDTQVFARPACGRAFFEGLIRDHLDIGRPGNVVLLFDKKLLSQTPGKFSTKVLTRGVDPQLGCVTLGPRRLLLKPAECASEHDCSGPY